MNLGGCYLTASGIFTEQGSTGGCAARHNCPEKGNKKIPSSKKKKKKQLFKGNTTAKTCLIKNKDLIASQMIPRLQHRNENTYQVYSFRVTGRNSKAYLGKSSKRLQDTSSEDRY